MLLPATVSLANLQQHQRSVSLPFWFPILTFPGMTTKSLVKMARETASLPIKRRRESVGTVAVHIHECLTLQHKLRENSESSPLPVNRKGETDRGRLP